MADDTPRSLSRRLAQGRGEAVEAVISGDPDVIRRELRGLHGVYEVTVAKLDGGDYRVVVTGDTEDLQGAVARAVVAHGGLGLRSLNTQELSLEDAFLQLTGEERT